MGIFAQPRGERGSLKWIQRAVNDAPQSLNEAIGPRLAKATMLRWVSPLLSESFAEYRDADFLRVLGLTRLSAELEEFWPTRGPQWDALGVSNANDVLLVEAKAHIAELCSPGSAAGPDSLGRIESALESTADALGAKPLARWSQVFYQLGNRLAHLHFLRERGVPAWLVLVNFVGDKDMRGPETPEAWSAAYQVAWHVMGLPKRHKLSAYILEVYPDVALYSGRGAAE